MKEVIFKMGLNPMQIWWQKRWE